METRKIGILSWESLYSVRTGGQAPAVTGLAEALATKGHEVHFFTRPGEGQESNDNINDVFYHRCPFEQGDNILEYCRNMSYSMLDRISEIERDYGKFHIVHGHDWHVVDALHELKGKRDTVLTFHSTEFGRNGSDFGDWWEFKEISSKEWYGAYIADKITTVSHTMKNELIYLYQIPGEKVSILPNGIDPRSYQEKVDAGRVKERYDIHPLAPMVFFVGRLVKQKGPDLLIEAIPHILHHREDAKFIIAGQGDMRDHLEQQARGLGVEHAVRFPGYISDEERITLFNSCDMVAITSRNEPFGMVLLEAWSASKPVIATDIGGPAENIDNFKDGIKVFSNPQSIGWGINYAINDPEGLISMGSSGRVKVEREFAWPKIAAKAEGVYKQLGA